MSSLPCLSAFALLLAGPAAAAVGGDQILCAVDRPCIDDVTASGGGLVLHWHVDVDWDRVVIRWATPDGERAQATLHPRNREGVFAIEHPRPGVAYAFRLQGCSAPRGCSPDETQSAALASVAGLCPAGLAGRPDRPCLPVPGLQRAVKEERMAEKSFVLPSAGD